MFWPPVNNRLLSAHIRGLEEKKRHFVELTAKLDAMSPLKVMTRGYAIAQLEDGNVLRSVAQVKCDDRVSIRVSDGNVDAIVTDRRGNGK